VADNRRTSARHAVSIQAQLATDGTPIPCTILNLSLGGALVSASERYSMGQRVQISFRVPTQETAIEVGATVRWSDASSAGIQFDGLRARDVWALNEFFKQLAG
jgi:c-di-GMP-binding flagellar brake protein YcgR